MFTFTKPTKSVAQILSAFTETVEELKAVSTAKLDEIDVNNEAIEILQQKIELATSEHDAAVHAIKKINSLFI